MSIKPNRCNNLEINNNMCEYFKLILVDFINRASDLITQFTNSDSCSKFFVLGARPFIFLVPLGRIFVDFILQKFEKCADSFLLHHFKVSFAQFWLPHYTFRLLSHVWVGLRSTELWEFLLLRCFWLSIPHPTLVASHNFLCACFEWRWHFALANTFDLWIVQEGVQGSRHGTITKPAYIDIMVPFWV